MSTATCERRRTALRVVGSFLAALILGVAPVALLSKLSDALLVLVFAFAFGLPALGLALYLQWSRHRRIREHLVRWCITAPFLAAAATIAASVVLAVAVLPWTSELLRTLGSAIGIAVPALYFGAIGASVFYLWESRALRRRERGVSCRACQASS